MNETQIVILGFSIIFLSTTLQFFAMPAERSSSVHLMQKTVLLPLCPVNNDTVRRGHMQMNYTAENSAHKRVCLQN